jgi:hypothetical protein
MAARADGESTIAKSDGDGAGVGAAGRKLGGLRSCYRE